MLIESDYCSEIFVGFGFFSIKEEALKVMLHFLCSMNCFTVHDSWHKTGRH